MAVESLGDSGKDEEKDGESNTIQTEERLNGRAMPSQISDTKASEENVLHPSILKHFCKVRKRSLFSIASLGYCCNNWVLTVYLYVLKWHPLKVNWILLYSYF